MYKNIFLIKIQNANHTNKYMRNTKIVNIFQRLKSAFQQHNYNNSIKSFYCLRIVNACVSLFDLSIRTK